MDKSYNPRRISELTKRTGTCFSIMTGAASPANGNPVIQPSLDELVYMYNVLGEMVNGLIDIEPKKHAAQPCLKVMGMYLVNGKCPICNNSEITLYHEFCKICGLPILREW